MKKIVFCDLDGTLITTKTGSEHPKGAWDVELKLDVWAKIKDKFPDMTHLFIATNQRGLEKGYEDKQNWTAKYEWVLCALTDWMENKKLTVAGVACSSLNDDDHYRKPNTGMLEYLLETHFNTNPDKSEMVMIGDASGKPGDFSDSDLKCAENFGIEYIDVRDL